MKNKILEYIYQWKEVGLLSVFIETVYKARIRFCKACKNYFCSKNIPAPWGKQLFWEIKLIFSSRAYNGFLRSFSTKRILNLKCFEAEIYCHYVIPYYIIFYTGYIRLSLQLLQLKKSERNQIRKLCNNNTMFYCICTIIFIYLCICAYMCIYFKTFSSKNKFNKHVFQLMLRQTERDDNKDKTIKFY